MRKVVAKVIFLQISFKNIHLLSFASGHKTKKKKKKRKKRKKKKIKEKKKKCKIVGI